MNSIRKRLTYANVLSSIAVFLVLGGATAFAATQLAKNSVGTKQLKKNAVTTAKIKKNAVTTAKIRKNAINAARLKANAVTTAKLKGAAVTGAKINAGTTVFGRVTGRLRNAGPVAFGSEAPVSIGTYAQPAGETDQFFAGMEVTFDPSCTAPREAIAVLSINPANPANPTNASLAAIGLLVDETGASSTHVMNFAPIGYFGSTTPMVSPEPAATESHSFYVYPVDFECSTGTMPPTGANIGVDVVGTK